MPTTVTVATNAAQIDNSTDTLREGKVQTLDFPQKGKNKGQVLVKVAGVAEPIAFDRDESVLVQRLVATREERVAYVKAWGRFYVIKQVVEALEQVNSAISSLNGAVARAVEYPHASPFGGSVLRDTPANVEAALATFRARYEAHRRELDAEGFDIAKITALAKSGSLSENSVYSYSPSEPVGARYYLDGTRDPDSNWTVAPPTREESKGWAREGENIALLTNRYEQD